MCSASVILFVVLFLISHQYSSFSSSSKQCFGKQDPFFMQRHSRGVNFGLL